MVRRAARVAFILFQFVLLNVFLPGHTRGAIPLPGSAAPADGMGAAASCCDAPRGDRPTGQAPTQRDRAHCAVCFLAARVSAPLVYDFGLTDLGLRATLPLPPPLAASVKRDVPSVYYGRAPPAAV